MLSIEILVLRDPEGRTRCHERFVQWMDEGRAADTDLTIGTVVRPTLGVSFGAPEIWQDIVLPLATAAGLTPVVEIAGVTPDVGHAIDRR